MDIYICGASFFMKPSLTKWQRFLGNTAETNDRLNLVLFEDLLLYYYILGNNAYNKVSPALDPTNPAALQSKLRSTANSLIMMFKNLSKIVFSCPVLIDYSLSEELVPFSSLTIEQNNRLWLYFVNQVTQKTDPYFSIISDHNLHYYRSLTRICLYCRSRGLGSNPNITILSSNFDKNNILVTTNNVVQKDPNK